MNKINRRTLIQGLLGLSAAAAVSGLAVRAQSLNRQTLSKLKQLPDTDKMPVLFLGHGSPMYAIIDTEFGRNIHALAGKIPTPSAILCISAHWETRGTWLTAMAQPKTIHDFGGFPQELFDVQYPAPGSPALVEAVQKAVHGTQVQADRDEWGLDHGTWSVLRRLYPEADIPVVQLSLDHFLSPQSHYDLAKELAVLRRKGVLIVGSGNVVHNLAMTDNTRGETEIFGYDWALETDHLIQTAIKRGDHRYLINFRENGKGFDLAVPTAEHYLPMLYALAAQEPSDSVLLFNDKPVEGSLMMTSLALGLQGV